jgi:hypothetical protein
MQVNIKIVVERIRFGPESIPSLNYFYFEPGVLSRHDLNAGLLFVSDL